MPSRMLWLPSPSPPGFSWSLQALPSRCHPLKMRLWSVVRLRAAGWGQHHGPCPEEEMRGGIRKISEVRQLGALLHLSFQGRAAGCFWYKTKGRWALLGAERVGGRQVGRAALSEVMLAVK